MSTRFYPRFVKGNPQLRIFLPDWPLVMVKPKNRDKAPDNVVVFKTDPRMTDWDIKNYLEKIYKVPVASIRSSICSGRITLTPSRRRTIDQNIVKDNDYRIAHVTLPIGQTFSWPNLFPGEQIQKELSDYQKLVEEANKNRKQWFQGID